MINFIICDDNDFVRKTNERIVVKSAMLYDFDYTISNFKKYDSKLGSLIKNQNYTKVYILDLELPSKSGIDIAREIRKNDWESIIIILTSHDELELKLLKEKLLIYDFISKFDNYEEKLIASLKEVIKKISSIKTLTIMSERELHNVKLDDILYIYRDSLIHKTIIVTNDDEFLVRESLLNLSEKLDSRFYQTHRACFVNIEKIKSIDFKNNIIYFTNEMSIDYLSRNNKKGLREKL